MTRAYDGGGYTDWFLPSKDELNLMYINKEAIDNAATANGGSSLVNSSYWSSSEHDNGIAWYINLGNGSRVVLVKNFTMNVRAVRAF